MKFFKKRIEIRDPRIPEDIERSQIHTLGFKKRSHNEMWFIVGMLIIGTIASIIIYFLSK